MKPEIYGVMARFETPDALLFAIEELRNDRESIKLEAYTPYAVEGLDDALGLPPSRLPRLTLLGGLLGAAGGFFMQWYGAVVSFPVNVGGRPLNSWPMFIPITFEMAVLCAALAAVFGMLLANGLPRLYHPVFNAPCFDLATRNKYFLCARPRRSGGNDFDIGYYQEKLLRLGAVAVDEVST